MVDDNVEIHDVMRQALGPRQTDDRLQDLTREIFGGESSPPVTALRPEMTVDCAHDGAEALAMVEASATAGPRYSVAFMDIRMPPGWDGIETTERLWQVDDSIQIVICTAYSDFRWNEILERLSAGPRLHLLRKPFAPEQARQIADVLCTKWRRTACALPTKPRAGHQ